MHQHAPNKFIWIQCWCTRTSSKQMCNVRSYIFTFCFFIFLCFFQFFVPFLFIFAFCFLLGIVCFSMVLYTYASILGSSFAFMFLIVITFETWIWILFCWLFFFISIERSLIRNAFVSFCFAPIGVDRLHFF